VAAQGGSPHEAVPVIYEEEPVPTHAKKVELLIRLTVMFGS
jgi:hypothetical protein